MGDDSTLDTHFDDASLSLGVLALGQLQNDDSPDEALAAHREVLLDHLGWERVTKAFELLACIALAQAMAIDGTREIESLSFGDEILDYGMTDQAVIYFMIRERVVENRVHLGAVTDELSDAYRSDPVGLAWAMQITALHSCRQLSFRAADKLGAFDLVTADDDAPAGITRLTLDWIAHGIRLLKAAADATGESRNAA